jgi:hypothetical protein
MLLIIILVYVVVQMKFICLLAYFNINIITI